MLIETTKGRETRDLMMHHYGKDFILNMGVSSFDPKKHEGKVIFNPDVSKCVDKIKMFKAFKKANVPHTKFYNMKSPIGMLLANIALIRGKKLMLHNGNCAVVSSFKELLKAKHKRYATEMVNNVNEYRVNIVGSSIISVKLKESKDSVRKLENSKFKMMDIIDRELAEVSLKAAKSVGIDLCGVDVIWDGSHYIVLEVNSCPGMGTKTSRLAVSELNNLHFERTMGIPLMVDRNRILVRTSEYGK